MRETEEELRAMTVAELRASLARQGVSLTDIEVSGGSGAPRKADLLSHALRLRRMADEAVSPDNPFQQRRSPRERGRPRRAHSPPPAPPNSAARPRPRTPARKRASLGWIDPELLAPARPAPIPAPVSASVPAPARNEVMPAPSRPARPRPPAPGEEAWERTESRRASAAQPPPAPATPVTDWDRMDAVYAQEPLSTPAPGYDVARTMRSRPGRPVAGQEAWEQSHAGRAGDAVLPPPQPAPVGSSPLMQRPQREEDRLNRGMPEGHVQPLRTSYGEPTFAGEAAPESDGGDEVIPSDSDGKSLSQGASSDADSTFLTDEEDHSDEPTRFEDWRVNEIKDYLARNKVPFIPKSRKATLVSLARAHATHLAARAEHESREKPAASAPAEAYPVEPESPPVDFTEPGQIVLERAHHVAAASVVDSEAELQSSGVTGAPDTGIASGSGSRVPASRIREEVPDVVERVEYAPEVSGQLSGERGGRRLRPRTPFGEGQVDAKQSSSGIMRETVREAAMVSNESGRRKVTSAPCVDDDIQVEPVIDVDAIETRPPTEAVRRKHIALSARVAERATGPESRSGTDHRANRSKAPRSDVARGRKGYSHRFSGHQKSRWPSSLALRLPALPRPSARSCARILGGLVVCLILSSFTLSVLEMYRFSKRPFCPNDSSEDTLPDGRECRPCPEHGHCVDGELECDMGYRRVDGRCAEDEEVSLYADHLASRAADLLRDLLGQKECGMNVESVLSSGDLREYLAPVEAGSELVSETEEASKQRRGYWTRRDRFDESKFDAAFLKALDLLAVPDAFGVRRDYGGGFRAIDPRLPVSCMFRRFVFRHWRFFLSSFAISVTWAYITIRRRLRAAHALRILEVCDAARDILKEQMVSYREGETDEKFVVDTHLRAEVLGNSPDAVLLWKEAEVQLGRDTRVEKIGPMTVGGHPCYVWQWRGRHSLQGSNMGSGSRRASVGSHGTPSPSAGRRVSSGGGGASSGASAGWNGHLASPYGTPSGLGGARRAEGDASEYGQDASRHESHLRYGAFPGGGGVTPHARQSTRFPSVLDRLLFSRHS